MDDVELTEALCAHLGRSIPEAVYDPEGEYVIPADAVGVFYGAIGSTPDRAVGVSLYSPSDDIQTGLGVRYAQVRVRGSRLDRTGADTLASAAFDALQGLVQVVGITLVSRASSATLGPDSEGRQERSENYTVVLDNQEA